MFNDEFSLFVLLYITLLYMIIKNLEFYNYQRLFSFLTVIC